MLRDELALTSQRLQAIIDERDSANQDLTSANEEIQSSNEELQSLNEKMETAKEELQSSNEGLGTLNEELQTRNHELSRIGDDLSNLMSSTTIPILLLDNELRIRRMTPVTKNFSWHAAERFGAAGRGHSHAPQCGRCGVSRAKRPGDTQPKRSGVAGSRRQLA